MKIVVESLLPYGHATKASATIVPASVRVNEPT
jgi:hypothetical protein